jgi:hypothetical protein
MKCTEILILKIRLALPIIAPDEGKSFAVAELQQSPLPATIVGFQSRSFAAEPDAAWMWTLDIHKDRTPTHGYEPTREAAMAAFAKSWRRE